MDRIQRQSDFRLLREEGRRVHVTRWLFASYRYNNQGTLRCAWTLSRKTGSAVLRNRIKRQCREFFRQEHIEKELFGCDINLVFRAMGPGFYKGLSNEELRKTLERLFQRLSVDLKRNPSASRS